VSERLYTCFARTAAEGRPALIAFVPACWPEADSTVDLVDALVAGGADVVELGVPFSDPLAEGPTNQAAYQQALATGASLAKVIAAAAEVRTRHPKLPLLLMGYINPLLAMGLGNVVERAAAAGVDGFIVVDLPVEESAELAEPARAAGLDMVYLLAPTSTPERIAAVAKAGSGFIYCVSVTGVTGARTSIAEDVPDFLDRVRAQTDLPLAVGFGISTREHVIAVGEIAEGAVVGSRIVQAIADAPPGERAARARAVAEELTGRAGATIGGQ
jgi:tryptophan synthase alpha subunit